MTSLPFDPAAVVEDAGSYPWAPGTATAIGSLPGTDIAEAVRTVFDELPDLPYLPELPARGPGADMIGRAAGLLVDMPVELYAGQWRIASHAGLDARRTRDLWERDLDALTAHAADFDGPLKTQVTGAWTLAAALDLPIGGRMLRDPGAVRDLTTSLAEGIAAHVAELRARLPYARILVQLDEPSLPAVLGGEVPTESGLDRLRAVAAEAARDGLATIISAAGVPVIVHCCAANVPLRLIQETGAAAVAVDLDHATDYDQLGEVLEAGLGLFAGAIRTSGAAPRRDPDGPRRTEVSRAGDPAVERSRADPDAPDTSAASERAAARVLDLWKIIGFSTDSVAKQVVVAPACGLAGLSPSSARAAMKVAREAARRLVDR